MTPLRLFFIHSGIFAGFFVLIATAPPWLSILSLCSLPPLITLASFAYVKRHPELISVFGRKASAAQMRKEKRNMLCIMLASALALSFFLGVAPLTGLYRPTELSLRDFAIAFAQFFLLFAIDDLVFYVWHRLMHTRFFWWAHRTHHLSVVTSLYSGFNFSVSEPLVRFVLDFGIFMALGQAMALPLFLPAPCFLLIFVFTTLSFGHAPFITPVANRRFARFFMEKVFHIQHHVESSRNFARSIRSLDIVFKTESEQYRTHAAAIYAGTWKLDKYGRQGRD